MSDIAIFDLDGTLTDSMEGIFESLRYAFSKMGEGEKSNKELLPFIGPPLMDSFTGFCGYSEKDAKRAVALYREFFKDKGIFINRLYDGVTEMLDALRRAGVRTAVGTSKPEVFAERIIEHFGLKDRFELVAGSLLDDTRSQKAEVLRYALDALGFDPSRDRAVMVGDRKHDVLGAREVSIPAVGVLYGYGIREELVSAGAWRLARDPDGVRLAVLERFQ